jgi:MFS family permease
VTEATRRDPILTRPFGLLVGAHFIQALGFSSMLLLPLYLDFLGASRTEIGAVMAAASIGGLTSRPLVGWALDVFGRKPTLIVGTLTLVLAMTLVAAVDRVGPLVFGVRILFGAGGGALFTGYFTLAADIVPESRRTEGLALFGISGLVPLLVNPLSDRMGVAPADLRWFLPVVGGAILTSLLFLPGIPETRGVREKGAVTAAAVRRALGARALAPVWVATGVFAGLVAVFMAFATVTAASRGVAHPTTLWLTYAAGAVGVRLFGAWLPEKVGPSRIAGAALLLYASGLATAAWASTDGGFALAGLLAGLGHGYCFPVLTAQVVDRSPDALRGVAMATFTGLWELTRLFFAPLFGWLADATNDGVMLRSAAAFAVVGLVVWTVMELRMGRSVSEGEGRSTPR